MKFIKKFCLFMVIITLFVGCSKVNNVESEKAKEKTEKTTIYTSFYPIYDVTKNIVGDKMNVHNLIPVGQEVHHWEPTAKDMSNLYKGSVLLVNGVNLEGWIEKFESALKDLIIVEVSKDVKLLKSEDHDEKKEHSDEVKPMSKKEEEHHTHGEYDPHIWLSLRNMKTISINIFNQVVSMDKANESYYRENLEKFHKRLDELDSEYTEKFKNVKIKEVITSHEAFAYLFNDYGLEQIAIEGINSDSEPDLQRVNEIIEIAKEKQIKFVFFEELKNSKIENTIANEIGGKVKVLYTVEGQTEEQAKENKGYLDMMKENLEALYEATN